MTCARSCVPALERLDWAYSERWAEFWEVADRLAILRSEQL
jgi:hypothetical protein